MQSTNTILSSSDLSLLEDALIKFGRIVQFDQLFKLADSSVDRNYFREKVALLVNRGWLLRLKKGQYLIVTDISTLGANDLSESVIAQALQEESYLSFENALQYHGLFDQALSTVSSVTTEYARSYKVQQTTYTFARIKQSLYFGFSEEIVNTSYRVKVAEAEKALLDMLYFRDSMYTVNVVLEKLRDYKHRLDIEKLKDYAKRYGVGMVRLVGFLLDQIEVNTEDLLTDAKAHRNSYNKMTATSSVFNAKWRLYYDLHAIA